MTQFELTKDVTITTVLKRTNTDPSIVLYEVEIVRKNSESWRETFGSEECFKAFLKGIVAGAGMICGKYIPRPPIPRT
jgi:hypothetical protein